MELGIDNTLKTIIIFPDGEICISNVGKYQIEGKNIIGTVYDDEDEDEEICFCYKIEELSCKSLVISDEEGNSLNFEKYLQEL